MTTDPDEEKGMIEGKVLQYTQQALGPQPTQHQTLTLSS
jgi:hypothetical protein